MSAALKTMVAHELKQLLEETFTVHHGIYTDKGTSLSETLGPIGWEQASRTYAGHKETIAGHVFHTTFYLGVQLDFIQDLRTGKVDWDESWVVTTVDAARWDQLRADLLSGYRRLLTFVTDTAEWENEDHFGGVLAILAHCAYHLGAIRQLKEL